MSIWLVEVKHFYYQSDTFEVVADDEDDAIEQARAAARDGLLDPEFVEVEIGDIRRIDKPVILEGDGGNGLTVCPECLTERPDDDRVAGGMKCYHCAYGPGDTASTG